MVNEVNKKKLVVALIFFIVLSLVLGSFIVYDKLIAKDDIKEVEDKKELDNNDKNNSNDNEKDFQNAYEKFIEVEKEKREDKTIEKSPNSDYEIRMTKMGEVYADVKATSLGNEDIVNQLLETQVVKYFIVDIGATDVGDSRELVFIKEDGSLSSISLGKLLINNEVKVNKNIGSLKNIVDVYDKVLVAATEYEPAKYGAFAKDINGKESDITNLIEDSRK